MIKKYLLFLSEQYYPLGFDDYVGSCDTMGEARDLATKKAGKHFDGCYNIVDHSTMESIESKWKSSSYYKGVWTDSDWECN